MLDHVVIGVADYERSKAFYRAALAPLGLDVVLEADGVACGFGKQGNPEFWVGTRERSCKPGLRELYHPSYYGAFVFDPDNNNIEAVCHKPA